MRGLIDRFPGVSLNDRLGVPDRFRVSRAASHACRAKPLAKYLSTRRLKQEAVQIALESGMALK